VNIQRPDDVSLIDGHPETGDLIVLLRVAGVAVSVEVAANALAISPAEVLHEGGRLVDRRSAVTTQTGYALADTSAVVSAGPQAAYLAGRLAMAAAESGWDPAPAAGGRRPGAPRRCL
jgi:hypothetical protein